MHGARPERALTRRASLGKTATWPHHTIRATPINRKAKFACRPRSCSTTPSSSLARSVQTATSRPPAPCRPPATTDAAFYEFEKEALFNHEWLCVGRESWVREPGDYFTTQIIGEPIVVARTAHGEITAMSSVCQHRAMLVAEGTGNTRGFVCPYHHWVYGAGRRAGERAGHGAHLRFRQEVRAPARVQGRDLAGLHLHQLRSRPRRRWRRAWPRSPSAIASYDLAARRGRRPP